MTSLRPHSIVYKQYKSQKSPGRQTTKEEALKSSSASQKIHP